MNDDEFINYYRELVLNVFKSGSCPLKSAKGSRLKKVTPKKMLERLPVALAQVKSGNNLNKIRQIVSSLYQSKETSKVYNSIINSLQM